VPRREAKPIPDCRVAAEKADLLHAIYDRIVVVGKTIAYPLPAGSML